MGVIFITGLANGVHASEYNTSSLIISGEQYNSPKMDCKTSDECLTIAHNNVTDYMYLFYTVDGYSSLNTTLSFMAFSTPDGWRDSYPHVYDVEYISTDDSWHIVNQRNMYKFYSSNQTISTTCTISDDDYWFFGVYNDTTNLVARMTIGGTDVKLYFIDGCDDSSTHFIGNIGTMGGSATPTQFDSASGFFEWKDTVTSVSDVVCDLYLKYAGAPESIILNLGSFPDSYDGMWHYIDNKIYYRNSTYIKTVSTTDFSSWGSPQDYWLNSEGVLTEKRVHYTGFDLVVYENSSGIYFGNNWEEPDYTPADEYVDGVKVYVPAFWWLGAKAYSPKVACEQDMQHCLMLVYDTTAIFGGLLGIYSVDGFQTPVTFPPNGNTFYVFTIPNVDLTEEVTNSNIDYMNLPYDIWYDKDNSEYYILATENTQGAKYYTYNIFSSLSTAQSFSLTGRIPDEFQTWKAFQIRGKDSDEPQAIILHNSCYSSILSTCHGFVDIQQYYLKNGTYIGYTNIYDSGASLNCPSAGYGTAEDKDIDEIGTFLVDTNDYLQYEIYGDFSCNGIQTYDTLSAGTFPTTSLGYNYYKEGQDLVYMREEGASVNEGNWYISTEDFLTYSSPVLYYAWDKANGESIPRSDRTLLSGKRVYTYERNHYTDFGIYVYIEEVFPIYVFGRYVDPLTGEPDLPVNQSVTLTCPNGYSTTDIDSDALVYTICDTAMNMSIYTSGFIPTSDEITFDIPSGCTSSMFVYVSYLPSSYSPNITVRDRITGQPISGAVVKFNNIVQGTTDADGKLQVSVNPIQDSSFVESSYGCGIYLDVTGTPREYWVQASAGGYRTTNEYDFVFAEEHSSGGTTYYTYKAEDALTVYLDSGADVQVRVYTSDGVQVEGNLVTVKSEGADSTFLLIDDIPTSTDTATSFPATFRLVDSRTSWSANFTLTQEDYVVSQNVSIINTTNYYSISFTLPDDSGDQPCNTILDCTASYCIGNYFYDLQSCTAGKCVYDVESCVLCDDEAGCYNEVTTQSCYFDSECYDLIECVNTAVLQDARCSEAGVCVLTEIECDYGCEDGVCVGAPTVEYCDQSTPAGMIHCLQIGMMNFMGSVYDPMFTILIAIFIAVIVGTMIGLAFKGASKIF
jgi:hypothetical protein